ncbi:MAG TPA: oligosaccharide flippase family protein [Steroidobacteraceae bacterium]|nr:oligosaccharide flippase family protein [Steroidobacteraceae bacterium]
MSSAAVGFRQHMPSLAGNVLWNWGSLAFGVAITFVLSPFVVRSLGDSQYGAWVLLGSLVGYLGLLDLGVRGAVTRYVAKLHSEGADGEASRLVSTALSIFTVMGGAAIVLSTLAAIFLVHYIHISPDEAWTARVVLCIGGVTMAATLLGATFGGIVIGLQRFDRAGQIEIGVGLLRAACVYLALNARLGLIALALIQLGAAVIKLLANAGFARRLYPGLHWRFGSWDPVAFREILSFSWSSTLLMFASSIVFYSDSVVIGTFLPVAAVTLFAIASSLVDYARNVLRGLSTAITPRTSALELHGIEGVARATLVSTRVATLLILPITLTFIFRGSHFIGLWMGQSYAHTSGQILAILSYALSLAGAGQVLYAALLGLGRHKGLVPFNLSEAGINLLLSIVLVRTVGLVGVAWAITGPNLVVALVVLPWYARHHLGIGWRAYYWSSWLRPFAANIPFACATVLVERFWPATGLASYFAGVAAVLPLAAIGAWVFALDPPERASVRAAVHRLVGRVPAAA